MDLNYLKNVLEDHGNKVEFIEHALLVNDSIVLDIEEDYLLIFGHGQKLKHLSSPFELSEFSIENLLPHYIRHLTSQAEVEEKMRKDHIKIIKSLTSVYSVVLPKNPAHLFFRNEIRPLDFNFVADLRTFPNRFEVSFRKRSDTILKHVEYKTVEETIAGIKGFKNDEEWD